MKRVWFLMPLPSAGGVATARADGAARGCGPSSSVPDAAIRSLMSTLGDLGLVHVEVLRPMTTDRTRGAPEDETASFESPDVTARGGGPSSSVPAEIEARVAALRHILEIFDGHAPVKRGFGANFVTLPLEVTRREYDRAVAETDVEALRAETLDLAERHAFLSRRHDDLSRELETFRPWAARERGPSSSVAPIAGPPVLTHAAAFLGTIAARAWEQLADDPAVRDLMVLRRVAAAKNRILVAAVALKANAEASADLLARAGFEPLEVPADVASIGAHVAALEGEAEDVTERLASIEKALADLAAEHRADVTVCLAHWERAQETRRAVEGALRSRRVGVVTGYARSADVPALRRALAEREPAVSLLDRDPGPDEQVPVSVKTAPVFAPAQFLTRLFGVPDYFGFDPSPFILLTFLIFFGFCFGDVVYGLAIFLLARWIAKRVKTRPNLKDFFTLISWGGVASIVVGAVTGAWMADLFKSIESGGQFFSEGSFVVRMRSFFMVEALDPMDQPVRVLVVALFIGILNQFYGIVLRMYREARRRDYVAAVCDGGLWLLFLPGLIILVMGGLAEVPGWLSTAGLILLVVGAVGLVLTQGRREKGLFAKALTGVISLYGILGTYGTTTFIGDTLSYSRLLALGLTTSIVGMSFNIIAGLVKGVPVAGIVLVMVVLLIGHVFNILVSILGAFVHSGRLVFVEFFGRFYEVGGKRFRALGTSERVQIFET